jgi:hypothetical protein
MATVVSEPAIEAPRRLVREDGTRRCIVTGQVRPKAELIRFALAPDDSVVPDLTASLPGRGAWVMAARDVLERALKTGAFARAFDAPARASERLVAEVERLLVIRCIDRLRLARRAGAITAGSTAVERWLRIGRAAILILASDAGEGRRLRVRAAGLPVYAPLSADELGTVFGWSKISQLALASGGLTDGITVDLRRLEGFRDAAAQHV